MKYAIWGMGLLGTSLALDLKRNGHDVLCILRSNRSRELLQKLGFQEILLTSEITNSSVFEKCDGIIIGTPVEQVFSILESLQEIDLPSSVWVTDMASTKAELMIKVEQSYSNLSFIGSHPMAGSDQSGPQHGREWLFKDATIYITPAEGSPQSLRDSIKAFWSGVSGLPVEVSYQEHDKWAAYLSHGLHLISCFVSLLIEDVPGVLGVTSNPAGGSFRDITRVSGSNPELWDGIIKSNKKEVIDYLKRFEQLLAESRAGIEDDSTSIKVLFEKAAEFREKIVMENI